MTVCPIRNVECSGMTAYDYMQGVQRDAVISMEKVKELCGSGMNLYALQDLENPIDDIPRPDCALVHFVVQEVLGGDR